MSTTFHIMATSHSWRCLTTGNFSEAFRAISPGQKSTDELDFSQRNSFSEGLAFMSEFPEVVGSMPSVPEHKPPQQKPKSSNLNIYVGFFLCAVCLLVFPRYVNTDNLNTGIFYGIGLVLLSLAIAGLCMGLSKSRDNKSLEAAAKPARPRKRRGLYMTRLFFGLLLFGLYLLEFPTAAGFL